MPDSVTVGLSVIGPTPDRLEPLLPEEVAFLAQDLRCAQCGHCAIFHVGTIIACALTGCGCTGFVEPLPVPPVPETP